MKTIPRTLLCLVLALPGGAFAQEQLERFQGYAYDLESGRYLFTEVVEQHIRDGGWLEGRTRYVLADGRELARKTIDFTTDPFVPLYRIEQLAGVREGITANGDPVSMERTEKGRTRTATARRAELMAADAGLPRLLRANFDALLAGQSLKIRIIAPLQLDTYGFKARRIADAPFEDKPATQIEVAMDSMLKLFAGPLRFSFDPQTRRLLEFRGVTNLVDPASGEPYTVRISYYTVRPKDVPEVGAVAGK
ncbi:MAG TPA: hypothetical protein VM240_12805 [Verrucomicrobiae bacterium]|nr:hypothetical protein [Verrucomicrobiae bacterium]